MKYLLVLVSFVFVMPVFAEALGGKVDRVAECRRKMHSRTNMYIEDVEYCRNLLMRESVEKFNEFAQQRGPVVDCQEAKENPDLVNDCRAVGVHKVKEQAKAWGITVANEDVYACDVDNSHWVFSNYVWFCADTPRGKISQMTQKPKFRDCF
jgi:hypothetical protein